MSAPLDLFVELANAQGPAYPRGSELPWTAARPRDFELFSMFMQGRSMRDFMTAGTSLKTAFDPKIYSSGFAPVKPASDLKRGSESGMFFMETPMTEYRWQEEITWHEFNLQPGRTMSDENVQEFWNIKAKRDKDFVLDPIIKMERALSATPTAEMFDSGGTGIMPIKSLFSICNLWETRHGVAGENLFPGMANQQGLDPEADVFKRVDAYGKAYTNGGSQLAPTKVSYAQAGNANLTNDHLFTRMKFFLNRLSWRPIPMAGSYADAKEVRPNSLVGTDNGVALYDNTARAHGELFATISPVGDAAQTTAFRGIPIIASDTFADAAIYPDVSGGVADAVNRAPVVEADEDGLAGARFYAIDPRTTNIWFNRNRPWSETEWSTMMPLNRDVMFRNGMFMGNLHCENFVCNGILFPSVNQASYAIS